MQYRMFHTTDVHIYRQIFVSFFFGYQLFVIFIIYITQEIPGRTCPLWHSVGLAFCRSSAGRALAVNPFVNSSQWRFTGSCRFVGFYIRQTKRKFFFRYRNVSTFRAVNDRDRFAPVTLTGEYPVTQFEVYGFTSDTHLFDHHRSFFLQYRRFHTVPVTGVDHSSRSLGICFCHIFDFFSIFCDNLNDRNIELGCKFKVTVIMGRYTHDCSGTVISQYIVRQPDRYFGTI